MENNEFVFEVGKSYLNSRREEIVILSIDGERYDFKEKTPSGWRKRWFEVGSILWERLCKINTNPNRKELRQFWAGGCVSVSDVLFEEDGDFKNYASIYQDNTRNIYDEKGLLTPEEIAYINSIEYCH